MADEIQERVTYKILTSNDAGKGASLVGIKDTAGAYTGTDLNDLVFRGASFGRGILWE